MSSDGLKGRSTTGKGAKEGGGGKESDMTKAAPLDGKMAALKVTRCPLLEMPAEIRNRIYYFAQEELYEPYSYNPPILVRHDKTPPEKDVGPRSLTTMAYHALTQVCKQVRIEYRPLWLRNSSFRMELALVKRYIQTFYPKVEDYQNAPKLLFVSWDHGSEQNDGGVDELSEVVLHDITIIVRLRAHCPTFTARFISRRVLEGDCDNVPCGVCDHSIYCHCDNGCDHEDAFEQALMDLELEYVYMDALNDFLENSNPEWLKMMRKAQNSTVRIEFNFDMESQCPTIYIRFHGGRAPKAFELKDMYHSSLQFLKINGLLELHDSDRYGWVIGESTGLHTRHLGCGIAAPVYNQIFLSSPSLQDLDKATKKATS